MEKTYGDLPVSVSLETGNGIVNSDNLQVCYDLIGDTDEADINIRNFPY
jgi:hypothetical protein